MKLSVKPNGERKLDIFNNKELLGRVEFYQNSLHNHRVYLNFIFKDYPFDNASDISHLLLSHFQKNLQVMTSSANKELAKFLTKAGFVKRRSCFEHSETLETYIGQHQNTPLITVTSDDILFQQACQLLFNHYCKTHQYVNPFSGSYQDFFTDTPNLVILNLNEDGKVDNCAFLEENEIAYVAGRTLKSFEFFIQSVIPSLFQSYSTIEFECDDCDEIGMILHQQFLPTLPTNTWDTYTLDNT